MRVVTRREWTWLSVVAVLLLTASTIPYLVGYQAQTPQERFAGALLNHADYRSRLATMWQGLRGEWQYRLLFTSEDHQGVYVQMFYVALGHLARSCGLGLPLTYQIARLVFGFPMFAAIYAFIARFVSPVRTRQVGFLLATMASGLGWLTEILAPTPPIGVSPMDFWMLSGFTYLAVLTTPHFCAATALLLGVYLLLLEPPEGPSLKRAILAILASLGLGIIHPYALLLADLPPVLYWSIEALRTRRVAWRGLATVVAMGLAQAPLVIYDLWVFTTQPVFAGWAAQNVTLSPPVRIYLEGYGLLLLAGAVGAVVLVRQRNWKATFPLLWIALVALLVYLPWNLQRRFLEGVQVPLGLFAGVGLADGLLPERRSQRAVQWRWLALALAVALITMSNLYLTAALTAAASARLPELFWSADLLAGLDWLAAHSAWDETVLAACETGSLVAGHIGHRMILGHGMETVAFREKQGAVARFFAADTPDQDRQNLLRQYGIVYIVHSRAERALGLFDPAAVPYLEGVLSQGEVAVYRVRGAGSSSAPGRETGHRYRACHALGEAAAR
jgi:hypothetical protein